MIRQRSEEMHELFSIPKHLFFYRTIHLTVETLNSEMPGDSKNAFLHCGDVLRVMQGQRRSRWVNHLRIMLESVQDSGALSMAGATIDEGLLQHHSIVTQREYIV